ncbi:uncharacterized protein LOC129589613 [Paramacrobiotus metropolitanus]|uniref:uncharacterized protein LOC129589613 n=1 Tax=Paramacrobiotus metropolitanus TaxID=2943436 RepID=UPI002445FD8D|nr:uncharacterized protein LOC129589613 [Paramacrobiotus metropolitanus]
MALFRLIFYVLVAVLVVIGIEAVSDESGNVLITEDIFHLPLNLSDAGNKWTNNDYRLWPNRTAIPYYLSSFFDRSEKQIILKAFRQMEKKTKGCVMFKDRTDEPDYLYFQPTESLFSSCVASVGRQGGAQNISLRTTLCFSIGILQMVIMRALGFGFEQKRPDREQYVEVHKESILSLLYDDHYGINPSMYTSGTKYDYHSILHYGAFHAALSNEHPAMIPKKGLITRMGQRARLSPIDVAKIMVAYRCPLEIFPAKKEAAVHDADFPNFSMDAMQQDECAAQFNRYCHSDLTTVTNCTSRKDFRIVCVSSASVRVLERMAMDMAEEPLRPVSINVEETLIAKYLFKPLQRQVVKLRVRNGTTNRVTSRLNDLMLPNLLHFELYHCHHLVIEKADFIMSKRLRIILLRNSTIDTMHLGSLTDLPDLQVLSLEAIPEGQQHNNFEQPFRDFLRRLHCDCGYAWYRSWWRANKQMRLRVDVGEIYSFEGIYSTVGLFPNTAFESESFGKQDLYHPIDCSAEPFPLGSGWINYYSQVEYSINEPDCSELIVRGYNYSTNKSVHKRVTGLPLNHTAAPDNQPG